MIPIFDTHTHDYFDQFDEDRSKMMHDDFLNGVVGKVQIGCDLDSTKKALNLAHQYENTWCTLGIHPCEGEDNFEKKDHVFLAFEELYQNNAEKIVAIGETGFDFFHNDSPQMREHQGILFEQHLFFARSKSLPVIVHTRNARNETLDFFNDRASLVRQVGGVIHCFCEDSEFAKTVTEQYGFFLGIGGTATYKKNDGIRKAIENTKIDFLVTETDSPYLAPQSKRGQRNQSKNIVEIVEIIAEIKNIPLQECSEILVKNAKRLFNLPS